MKGNVNVDGALHRVASAFGEALAVNDDGAPLRMVVLWEILQSPGGRFVIYLGGEWRVETATLDDAYTCAEALGAPRFDAWREVERHGF